jgi:hypothetical protein
LISFRYPEAAANILTRLQFDLFGEIPEFKYRAACVERVAVLAVG